MSNIFGGSMGMAAAASPSAATNIVQTLVQTVKQVNIIGELDCLL